jgi:hypothetical protein
MNQWRKTELSPWQRVAAARARGERPDPEDVEEARRRALPDDTPAWARAVAERAVGGNPPAPEPRKARSKFEKRLMARLSVVDDGPPDAA